MTAAVTLRVKDIGDEEIDVKVGDEDWLLGVYGGRTSEEAYDSKPKLKSGFRRFSACQKTPGLIRGRSPLCLIRL